MAIGYEIILGFTLDGLQDIEKALDTNFRFNDEDYYEYLDENMDKLSLFSNDLNEAYIKTLKEVGFKPIDLKEFVFETPLGSRNFRPFRLEHYFDPVELGEKYDDIVIGISLSGRYYPVLLDWKEKNGSLYTMVIDEELNSIVNIAKKNIAEKISVFKDAKTIIKLIYY